MARQPWIALVAVVFAALAAPASSAVAPARPFPFHVIYAADVLKPTNVSQAAMDATIAAYYARWKTTYLRKDGGEFWVKFDDTNTTVSEAHGYGMVLAAYFGDKPVLDSMVRYYKAHPSRLSDHLMAWKQTLRNGRMVNIEGPDSATDGDLDVAYALLLAHVQWGSSGPIAYRREAILLLHDILLHEVNPATMTLTLGDWATGPEANATRPSDFMTSHLLAFAKYDAVNAEAWQSIARNIAKIVNFQFTHGSQITGLMPDFMVKSGNNFVPVGGTFLESAHDGDFSYNACRTPWRLAMSYILKGRTDMLPALRKQAAWIKGLTGGDPSRIKAGYFVRNGVNGKAFVTFSDLPFTAPFAVVAMTGGGGQVWLNRLWSSITGEDFGLTNDYYGDTIRLQVMLTLAGDWWLP